MDLHEAWDVLSKPARLDGGCPAGLIEWVREELAATVSMQPSRTKAVQSAVGLEAPVLVRPLDALLELAKATAPRVRDDVYDTYRHWAWLRYLGSLSRGPSDRLELSEAALEVGGNQRRVMSEELGVGFGVNLAASVWARGPGSAGYPLVADVDVALADGYGWSRRVKVSGRKPDYLLLLDSANDPTVKSVRSVECKGTASSAYSWTQMAKAMTQLNSLTFDGVVPQGVAIATVSGPGGIEYLALDPEEDRAPTFSITTEKVGAVRRRKQLRTWDGTIDVSTEEMVLTAATVSVGSLADYAGNVRASRKWLPPATTERLARGGKDRLVVASDRGEFRGVESVFPTPTGGRLRVFQGIEASIDDALADAPIEEVLERQALFNERSDPGLGWRSEVPDRLAAGDVISSSSGDGALLRLEIE